MHNIPNYTSTTLRHNTYSIRQCIDCKRDTRKRVPLTDTNSWHHFMIYWAFSLTNAAVPPRPKEARTTDILRLRSRWQPKQPESAANRNTARLLFGFCCNGWTGKGKFLPQLPEPAVYFRSKAPGSRKYSAQWASTETASG